MSNLDSDVLGLATRDNSNEYIDAVWSYGSGAVYYSTTPTDHYIDNNFAENDAWDAYALNSLHYATSMIFDGYSQMMAPVQRIRLYGTTGDDAVLEQGRCRRDMVRQRIRRHSSTQHDLSDLIRDQTM